jgi:hypothetical protein
MPLRDPQLIQWINDDLRLPVTVSPLDFERAFANGELFAAILRVLEQRGDVSLEEGALDGIEAQHTTAVKLANFSILRTAFASLDVRCGEKLITDIITEQRGAAASLVLDLKAAAAKRKQRGGLGKALQTAASLSAPTKSRDRDARYVPANPQEAFAHHLLASGMGHKQAAIEMRLLPFEQARAEREHKVCWNRASDDRNLTHCTKTTPSPAPYSSQ